MIGENEDALLANASRLLEELDGSDSPRDLLSKMRKMNALCSTVEQFAEQLGRQRDDEVQRFYFQVLVPENAGMVDLLAQTLKERL